MEQLALSLEAARMRGHNGMQRAAERADRKHAGWAELAAAALLAHVQTLAWDAVFIIEDIRAAIESEVPAPTDLRAWGAVTQAAIRRGYIVATGEYAPAKSSNASPKPLYRRGGAF